MKVLILGASGFLGRNLVEYFRGNNTIEVIACSHSRGIPESANVKNIKGDLTNSEFVNSLIDSSIDVILQFAASTSGAKDIVNNPAIHVTDNAVMNSYIFKAAHVNKVRQVIFPSCTVMYQSSDKPLNENDFDPRDELIPSYFGVGQTKLYLEKVCEFFARHKVTKYTVLRHSNIYGPFDKYDLERSHFTGASIRKVLDAECGSEIVVWGDGKTERDLLYASDFVAAVDSCMTLSDGAYFKLFNVGCGESVSVFDVLQKLIKNSGKDISIKFDTSKPSISSKLAIDASKFHRETGWSPSVGLDAGLKLSYEWLANNIDSMRSK